MRCATAFALFVAAFAAAALAAPPNHQPDPATTSSTSTSTTATGPTTTNLLTWLDPTAPNAYVLARDGIHIRQWTDQSPRAKHFVQNNPNKMPVLVPLDPSRARRDDGYCDYCGVGTGNGTGMVGSGGTIGSSPYRRRATGSVAIAHIFVVCRNDDAASFDLQSIFQVKTPNGRTFLDVGNVEFAGGSGTAFAVSLNKVANTATAVSSYNSANPLDVWAISVEPQMGWSTRITIYKNNAFLSTSVLLGTPPYGVTDALLARTFTGVIGELLVYSDMKPDDRTTTTMYLCDKHAISC